MPSTTSNSAGAAASSPIPQYKQRLFCVFDQIPDPVEFLQATVFHPLAGFGNPFFNLAEAGLEFVVAVLEHLFGVAA